MKSKKANNIFFLMLGIILVAFNPLIAQNRNESVLRQHRKEIKTRLMQLYQDKLSESRINVRVQRNMKPDSVRIAERMKRKKEIRAQMQVSLKKEQDNKIKSGRTTTAVNVQDSLALVALYNSTNGSSWFDNTNWLTGPVNTWYGITVAVDRVDVMSLDGNNLTGTIPAELGNLTNLEILVLWYNQLTGSIPAELGNLTNLKHLDLDNNQLTGSIPAQLGNLTNVGIFWINQNQLTGSIPAELGNLANLKELDLYRNQLTGSIPAELGNLTNLEYLDFGYNQLSGSIPAALGNLNNLIVLYLDMNQLTGSIPAALGNLNNLIVLYLDVNQLSGFIPSELGNLTNLIELYFNSNKLFGPIPTSLTSLTSLIDDWSDFRWNALYTDNNPLRTFLNNKQDGDDWESTQTIAPENVSCACMSTHSVRVSWTPITYIDKTGGYRVFYSTTSGGPYTEFDITNDKTKNSMLVTGLNEGITYYFVVKTQTNPHSDNQNTVVSDTSDEISCITQAPEIRAGLYKIDFGEVYIDSSKTFTFTVSNSGNIDLIVKRTLLYSPHYGPVSDRFSLESGGGSYTLAPGDGRDVVVKFHPITAGRKFATLEIQSNDPDNAKVYIQVLGKGIEKDLVPPEIVNCFPPSGSLAIHKNSDIQFTITDSSGTGVDSSSITVVIDDTTIVSQGADQTGGQVIITSHSPCYTIYYDPVSDFTPDSAVTVTVQAADLAGIPNALDTTYTFTTGSSIVTTIASDSIDQSGGTVSCDTSEVSVTIPAGALENILICIDTLEIKIGTVENALSLPDSVISIGLDYYFGPAGLQFADSVTLNIPYTQKMLDDAEVIDPEDLPVYYFLTTSGEWIHLDITGHNAACIQVKVNEFCYFITGKHIAETGVKETEDRKPNGYTLKQNHPNPFNPTTEIIYSLPKSAHVTLTVYNMLGQPVRILVDSKMSAGSHQVMWDAQNDAGQTVPTGIYIYILKSSSYTEMRKALLMK